MSKKPETRGKAKGHAATSHGPAKKRRAPATKLGGTIRLRPTNSRFNLIEMAVPEDFQTTTDVRVTTDRLWLLLLRFRRWLVEDPLKPNHPWPTLLHAIQQEARQAGVKAPHVKCPWIVALLEDYRRYEPITELCQGRYTKHDYVLVTDDGFARHYEWDEEFCRAASDPLEEWRFGFALSWVEGWMRFRERQLCQLGSHSPRSTHDAELDEPSDAQQVLEAHLKRINDEWAGMRARIGELGSAKGSNPIARDYLPVSAFKKEMGARLRQATTPKRKGKRVRAEWIDGVKCYCVADVLSWWPNALTTQRE